LANGRGRGGVAAGQALHAPEQGRVVEQGL